MKIAAHIALKYMYHDVFSPPPPKKTPIKKPPKETILLEDFLFPQPLVWRPDSSVVAGTTTSLERRGSAI